MRSDNLAARPVHENSGIQTTICQTRRGPTGDCLLRGNVPDMVSDGDCSDRASAASAISQAITADQTADFGAAMVLLATVVALK